MFDVSKAIEAQREYTSENKYPHFAPPSGLCYKCRQQIYSPIDKGTYITGISVERAGSELVTGCPHCNRSYCD